MKASTAWLLAALSIPAAIGVASAVLRFQASRMRTLFNADAALPATNIALTLDAQAALPTDQQVPLEPNHEDLPALAIIGDSWLAGMGEGAPSPAHLIGAGLSQVTAQPVRVRAVARPAAGADDIHEQVSTILSDARMRRSRSRLNPPRYAVVSMGSADVIHPFIGSIGAPVFTRALNRLQHEGGYTVIVLTCPNLGLLPGVRRPLRTVLRRSSRVMSGSQWVAAVSTGALPISLNHTLSGTSHVGLLAPAGRYPSPLGYRQIAAAVLARILSDMNAEVVSTDPSPPPESVATHMEEPA